MQKFLSKLYKSAKIICISIIVLIIILIGALLIYPVLHPCIEGQLASNLPKPPGVTKWSIDKGDECGYWIGPLGAEISYGSAVSTNQVYVEYDKALRANGWIFQKDSDELITPTYEEHDLIYKRSVTSFFSTHTYMLSVAISGNLNSPPAENLIQILPE